MRGAHQSRQVPPLARPQRFASPPKFDRILSSVDDRKHSWMSVEFVGQRGPLQRLVSGRPLNFDSTKRDEEILHRRRWNDLDGRRVEAQEVLRR